MSSPGHQTSPYMRFLPEWARWSPAAALRPWTIGVEEEAILLDPRDGSPANRIDDVLAALPHAAPETHACVVELRTDPHVTVPDALAELARRRSGLDAVVRDRLGLRAAGVGAHPLAVAADVGLTGHERYREIGATMRVLARREPTMAQHVHVAVPDGDTAVRALDGLRDDLPLLLALSANSPYWGGADSGFASMRTPLFSMFPRTGIPRAFGSYADYVHAIHPLIASGALPDAGYLWWDARLQPRLGTVEVRVMDAQSRVGRAGALAALVHCLVLLRTEGVRAGTSGPEVLSENRFLAARDGMRAELIDAATGTRRPVRDLLARRLEECAPLADGLGCASELDAAAALADDPGDERQRRAAARDGVHALPAWLAREYTAGVRTPAVVTA
jgi:glutamate---cysteine ligase / carboxylate-amine ligase